LRADLAIAARAVDDAAAKVRQIATRYQSVGIGGILKCLARLRLAALPARSADLATAAGVGTIERDIGATVSGETAERGVRLF
jgi:hypothetical protein